MKSGGFAAGPVEAPSSLRPRKLEIGELSRADFVSTVMRAAALCAAAICFAIPLAAEEGGGIQIRRAAGAITIDGDLGDPGWRGAASVDRFYELSPGDNTPPKVKTTAFVTYDDRFFYVAFRCDDPDPQKIRAQYVERDHVASDQDFVGIMLDTKNDGRTAIEFFVNPYGIEDDFARDESSSSNQEDASPDFYWDAAAKITATGWQAEIRIPFSTLRYSRADPQTWGIVFFRNWSRDFRYQIASNPSPRESNCFLCHELKIEGLTGLPRGAHFVAAPYATLTENAVPRGSAAGSSLVQKPARGNGGFDAKFVPNENTAFDATVNPDFSQVESDVAQISADTRFALFYPEKRPFFMEQSQLFNLPIQAVYTRTITSPRWGIRATGQFDSNSYTVLTGEDRGGGTVVLPGSSSSGSAPQDFSSFFGIGRIQHALAGRSFASFLVTDREVEGGGYNRVLGPDFQWTPGDSDQVVGQFLISSTQTPDRPDLAPQWKGQRADSRAIYLAWNHSSYHWNWSATYRDLGDAFRADDGFVPQVGIREAALNGSYVFYTDGLLSRVIPAATVDYVTDAAGRIVTRDVEPGIAWQGKLNMSGEIDYNARDLERAGPSRIPDDRWHVNFYLNPPGPLSSVSLDGHVGRSIDYVDFRGGHGGDFTLAATVRPTSHLQLDANLAGQWLNLSDRRLFTAQAERLKATYVFTRTTFMRLIGQYVRTDSNPGLYKSAVAETSGDFEASALLGYQLNWQSVVYLGYGDTRTFSDSGQLQQGGRELFLKISYAFQR
jgi:Domain of unknown function (DUF5916)/Carbohydrate family 9 binding domain-like